MLNSILAMMRRPERGWDPVPESHAIEYAEAEWQWFTTDLPEYLDAIGVRIGGFAGKRVLDLGGGPGQYSVALAQRGAEVVWHDVSAHYRQISQRKAADYGVADKISFSLGYLEDAKRFPEGSFDLVFNRICWYYCLNDAAFARIIYRLIRPGGYALIDCPQFPATSLKSRVLRGINALIGLKIGHPCPPPGRIEKLFRAQPGTEVEATILPDGNEQVLVRKIC